MKKLLCYLTLTGACVLAGSVSAADVTFDLRASAKRSSGPHLLSGPAGSCLKSSTLAAGATDTGALAVGDVLTFRLFTDVEVNIVLTERMESPIGGDVFIGSVSGYDGVKNAVVL